MPSTLDKMTEQTQKIMSIAPTFSCQKRCEGCYLTTGVTKEMRDAELTEEEWLDVIKTGNEMGYTELGISWNPMPNSIDQILKFSKYAWLKGMDVNITTTIDNDFIGLANKLAGELHKHASHRRKLTISLSCDDIHGYSSLTDFIRQLQKSVDGKFITHETMKSKLHMNLNLLWTNGVFDWLLKSPEEFKEGLWILRETFDSIQHLMMKPVTLYEGGWDEFIMLYGEVFRDHSDICIQGNGKDIIGDAAMNSILGINKCPSIDYQMLDIDPMGNIRICPENPKVIGIVRKKFSLGPLFSDENWREEKGLDLSELINNHAHECRKDKCICITGE